MRTARVIGTSKTADVDDYDYTPLLTYSESSDLGLAMPGDLGYGFWLWRWRRRM